jgi:hypothetical protein
MSWGRSIETDMLLDLRGLRDPGGLFSVVIPSECYERAIFCRGRLGEQILPTGIQN